MNVGVLGGDLDADFAVGAADVDDCCCVGRGACAIEIVVVQEMGEMVRWVEVGESHGGDELLVAALVFTDFVEWVGGGAVGDGVTL